MTLGPMHTIGELIQFKAHFFISMRLWRLMKNELDSDAAKFAKRFEPFFAALFVIGQVLLRGRGGIEYSNAALGFWIGTPFVKRFWDANRSRRCRLLVCSILTVAIV